MEREAAFALFNKSTLVKSNVHFDTTGRSSIDGEWPSLVLKFSDEIEYRLQPIFFAFEDREQITNLTFGRLIATLQVSHDQILQPKTLWEKVDAIMTDTVTKNTEVEETIAKALDSSHIPSYLLCKTYTVEALDKSSFEVLNEIAKSVKQQEIFETIHPALKSFFCGKTALVESGIEALLSLITLISLLNPAPKLTFFISYVKERVSAKEFSYINKDDLQNLGKQHYQYLKHNMY